ncbi:hypothetical protein [Halonatronum saccharophilum]|uniref:hypothetical protein n=1 Tax=Halonatronum saccharophilum TaxID=150060 RepID=UPI0004824E97|nr:hypothetical protein [Halonatronum saccharophilum]
MKSLFRKKIGILAILLVGILALVGCRGESLSDLTVELNTEAEVTISREGESKTESGKIVQFEGLPEGEYDLVTKADGYDDLKTIIVLGEDDLIVPLELDKIEIKPVEEEKVVKEIVKVDLVIDISDINENELDAKVILKKDGQTIATKEGSKMTFEELEPGEYTLEVIKDGYDKIIKDVTLGEGDADISLHVLGGNVSQYYVDSSEEYILIEDVAEGEELLVGISYLDLENFEARLNLDNFHDRMAKVEYDARKKGFELIERYGDDLSIFKNEYTLGDSKLFTLPNGVREEDVRATLEGVGKNIHVFVDNDYDIDFNTVDKLINDFDNVIYPGLTDGQNRDEVIVLLTDFDHLDITGYFNPADLYEGYGNEEAVFYLNADRGVNTLLGAAAHQYQHLVFFLNKARANRVANDAWIDEGLAQNASILAGYIDAEKSGWSQDGGNGWVYDKDFGYLNNTQEVNLLAYDGRLASGGATSLFATYILEQYGPELINQIMISSNDPKDVIEEFTGEKFNKIYLNWMTANIADRIPEIDSRVYNYSSFEIQEFPAFNDQVSRDGITYLRFEGEGGDISIPLPEYEGELGVVVIRKNK